MRNTKRHRYVSRSGPARDARWEALALARAENEGWPTDAPKWHKTRKVAPPPPAP
jgi:predicted kinase